MASALPQAHEATPAETASCADTAPVLRGLYDAPPQIPTDNDGVSDGNAADKIGSDDRWATEVSSGTIPTEEGSPHVLHYEVHRRFKRDGVDGTRQKRGLTALFLHGGPGAGTNPNHARFFSPELYENVVLLDQRGCGKSTPLGEVRHNTLELLVQDVERLRLHLLSESPWDVILGGSWGCTLALAYAHTYPIHVRGMVLRGVCLFRREEIDWLFGDPPKSRKEKQGSARTSNLRALLSSGGGESTSMQGGESAFEADINTAAQIYPNGWEEFCKGSNIATIQQSSLPQQSKPEDGERQKQRRNILQRYYHILMGSDPLLRFQAVKSWLRWEMGIYSSGFPASSSNEKMKADLSLSKHNSTVLVWDPVSFTWSKEDARVWNNASVISIDQGSEVNDNLVQSLRRFSPLSSPEQLISPKETNAIAPLPIMPVVALPSNESKMPKPKAGGSNGGNSINNFDPATYIPAQSMITCYYSTNDAHCIGPYRPFLSLMPPSTMAADSWYSSLLPPALPQQLSTTARNTTASTLHKKPLPPTIAIQGANDAVCPPDTALDLHNVWRELELRIVLEGSHSMYGGQVCGEIVKALDRFGASLLEGVGNNQVS